MGTKSTSALTEIGGGTAPAGTLFYVGIDVGRRDHVVVGIPDPRMADDSWKRVGVRKISTNGQGFELLTDWLGCSGYAPEQIRIGLEPTGGWYAQTVASWLERRGYTISWLQNWAIHERRLLEIGKQTKTDAIDARLIARLLYERERFGSERGFLHRAPSSTDFLRVLIRGRLRLVQLQLRYRNQLTAVEDVLFPELKDFFRQSISCPSSLCLLEHFPTPAEVAHADPLVLRHVLMDIAHAHRLGKRLGELQQTAAGSAGLVDDIQPLLQLQAFLIAQLRSVQEALDDGSLKILNALQAWPERDREILASFPRMTPLRQAVLLSTIGDVHQFSSDRQLRKLMGWYPEARESGSSVSSHHLGRSGNRIARRELWLWTMALLSPLFAPNPFGAYYARLRDRGMPGRVAVGHVAGKVISVLYSCLRNDQLYDPERHALELGIDRLDW